MLPRGLPCLAIQSRDLEEKENSFVEGQEALIPLVVFEINSDGCRCTLYEHKKLKNWATDFAGAMFSVVSGFRCLG